MWIWGFWEPKTLDPNLPPLFLSHLRGQPPPPSQSPATEEEKEEPFFFSLPSLSNIERCEGWEPKRSYNRATDHRDRRHRPPGPWATVTNVSPALSCPRKPPWLRSSAELCDHEETPSRRRRAAPPQVNAKGPK